MAAKSSVPTFNTLKECLEFLQWLRDRKGVQGQLGSRLRRLLEKMYISVNPVQIEAALSIFLNNATAFHAKLCQSPKGWYTGEKTAKNALNALFQCIPKFLAAIYFLRYQVDPNFSAIGGGSWRDESVGMIELYARMRLPLDTIIKRANNFEKYLIAREGYDYGVIPGGFGAGELKPGYKNGYSPASQMAGDLGNLLDKNRHENNMFLDVYSTTVLPNSGYDTANIANALRLVQDFCRIFAEVRDEQDFKSHLYSKDRCMNMRELKDHCAELKRPLEKIFTGGRFSFTGYGRQYDKLKKHNIAKKMASWFKKNLKEVKQKLQVVQPISNIKKLNRRSLRKGAPLPSDVRAELEKYFTNNFFSYGFTFYGYDFRNWSNMYDVLKTDWFDVIDELKIKSGGLDKLVDILNGKECKLKEDKDREKKDGETGKKDRDKEHIDRDEKPDASDGDSEDEDEASEDEDDEESEDEEDEPLQDSDDPSTVKTEATKTEAAKPVVTKAEATKTDNAEPTAHQVAKSDGSSNQGKKAEGAQNQGKKAEGAQNQGKKAEGAQNQGKKDKRGPDDGQSDTTVSSSPVAQPVQTQDSSVQSPGPAPSGAHDPSSGQEPGGQGSTSDAVQQSSQEVQTGARNSAPSRPQQSVTSSGGAGVGGGSGDPRSSGKSNTCSGNMISSSYLGDGKICFSKSNDDEDIIWNAQRQSMLEDHYKNEAKTLVRMQTRQQRNHPPTQSRYTSILPNKPSLHASRPPQQIVGRPRNENPYNAPQERDADHWDGSAIFLDGRSFTNPVTSQIAMEKAYEAEQKKYAHEWRANRNKFLDNMQKRMMIEAEDEKQRQIKQMGDYLRHVNEHDNASSGPFAGYPVKHRPSALPIPSARHKLPSIIGSAVADTTQHVDDRKTENNFQNAMQQIITKKRSDDRKISEAIHGARDRIEKYEREAENRFKSELRTKEIIERIRKRNEKQMQAANELDKNFEKTTEDIWKTQLQQNVEHIENDVKNEDAKKRLQQKRSEQKKKLEQQNISVDPPTSTPSTLPSQPSRPAPAPSGQNTVGPAGHRRDYYDPKYITRRTKDVPPLQAPVLEGMEITNKLSDPAQEWERKHWDQWKLAEDFRKAKEKQEEEQFKKSLKDAQQKAVNDLNNSWPRQELQGSGLSKDAWFSTPLDGQSIAHLSKPNMTLDLVENTGIEGQILVPHQPTRLPSLPFPQQLFPSPPQPRPLQPRHSNHAPNMNAYASDITTSFEIQNRNFTRLPDLVTIDDPNMANMTDVTGQPVVGVNGKVDISHIPSDSRLNDGDSYHLVGQEVQDDSTIKRRQQDLLNLQNEQLEIDFQNEQRERELLTLKQESEHINDKQKELMQAAQVDADRIRAFNDSQFDISSAPAPHVEDPKIDFSIQTFHYEDRPFNDVDLDDPYANTADILKDELRPAEDKGFSGIPQTNFDLNFAPERIGLEGYDDPGMPRDSPRKADERVITPFGKDECLNPWSIDTSSTDTTSPPASALPPTDHLPTPKTVREMLYWFVGLNTYGLIGTIQKYVEGIFKDFKGDAIEVTGDPDQLTTSCVTAKLTEACLYSATVIYRVRHNNDFKAFATFDFESVYSQFRYSPDPAGLLCQLRDYVYACHHQLQFLKSQCNRDKSLGGWQNCNYGSDITASNSPLQAFLTDGWDSTFETHLFDPCNLCLKSRVRMGFRDEDLPSSQQTGNTLSTILTPSCGGEDPLLTLCSYLNCLTRRTPRTTGELVSFFHNFGNEMHGYASKSLSPLGNSLRTPHLDCPDWDHLGRHDLQAVSGVRGTESLNSVSNHNHDNAHPRTLSTLVGCGSDPDSCHPRMSPITYRAYALYSQSFAHTYLSWTVYLPDRLWESLEKMYYDLKKHNCFDGKSLHSCPVALPLLYTHGFTPPEVGSQLPLTCQQIIAKLKEIVNGKPIASLMTAMDNFLYNIREPFIFTLVALWSTALLIFANTMLYRIDILHIRSHLIRTKASHLIDVKALLSDNKKMMSLYDANYFDDDPNELLNLK
ncbi:Ribosome-binding protein 1 [Babesia bigemina]|uniref:Ribosome-binding protein 1 n=1 Tax=Babesia bigemina TaxID=5866 RepID=A0A061D7W3_BABBI|nr:Ribosome-binding protein 1 [Babesia bigemina]CDR96087.1 Ribosome-binding protein 1 [Babesia bigemina]|eukprot:XP_012768273.1 Ribosome-binding protein 1 [Babesia bigemina]